MPLNYISGMCYMVFIHDTVLWHAVFTLWCCTGTVPVSLHTSTQYPVGIIIVSETHTAVLEWKHTISCHAHQMDYFVAMWALSREPCDRRQRQRAS